MMLQVHDYHQQHVSFSPPSSRSNDDHNVQITEFWPQASLASEVVYERQRVPLSPEGILELRELAAAQSTPLIRKEFKFTDTFVSLCEALTKNEWTKLRHFDCEPPMDEVGIRKRDITVTKDSQCSIIRYRVSAISCDEIPGVSEQFATIAVAREVYLDALAPNDPAWRIKVDCGKFPEGDYHTTVMISGDASKMPQALLDILMKNMMDKPVRPMIFEYLFRYHHDFYLAFENQEVIPHMEFTHCVLPEQYEEMETRPNYDVCLDRIQGVAHLPAINMTEEQVLNFNFGFCD